MCHFPCHLPSCCCFCSWRSPFWFHCHLDGWSFTMGIDGEYVWICRIALGLSKFETNPTPKNSTEYAPVSDPFHQHFCVFLLDQKLGQHFQQPLNWMDQCLWFRWSLTCSIMSSIIINHPYFLMVCIYHDISIVKVGMVYCWVYSHEFGSIASHVSPKLWWIYRKVCDRFHEVAGGWTRLLVLQGWLGMARTWNWWILIIITIHNS